MEGTDEEARKLYCGNLDSQVDEELLYELFLQAGPLEKIEMPRNRGVSGFAFVVFKHECSVQYAIELFEDTSLFGKFPRLRAKRTSHHQRTQSAPVTYGASETMADAGSSAQMNFDALLQMSRNMLNPAHSGMRPPHMGSLMGMRPPMDGAVMGMGPPMGGPMGMGPPMGGPNLPYSRHMQPCPPGEEEETFGDQSVGRDFNDRHFERSSLSQSSLQGNWSGRNASNMLPADDYRRSAQHSRRDGDSYSDRGKPNHWDRGGHRGGFYDREGDWRDDRRHPRDRHRGRHNDRDDYRSRSQDVKERRGRF